MAIRYYNGATTWTASEKEKLRDLYYEGYTDGEIAEQIGRSPKAVCSVRCAMKLPKKMQGDKKFVIKDAMAEYYPTWYRKHLEARWREQYMMS